MTAKEYKHEWLFGVFLIAISIFILAVVYNNYIISYNEYAITYNSIFLFDGIFWFLVGFFSGSILFAVGIVLAYPHKKEICKKMMEKTMIL